MVYFTILKLEVVKSFTRKVFVFSGIWAVSPMSFTFQEIRTIIATNESNGFPTVTVSCNAFLGTYCSCLQPPPTTRGDKIITYVFNSVVSPDIIIVSVDSMIHLNWKYVEYLP